MKRSTLLTALWITALLGSTAAAIPPPPIGPAEIAQSRAFADDVLAKAGVTDLFENVTTGGAPEVQHRASGLVCYVGIQTPKTAIRLDETLPRGDGVSCGALFLGNGEERLSATRNTDQRSVQAVVDADIAVIRRELQAVEPFEIKPTYLASSETGAPTITTIRLRALRDGQPVYVRTSAMIAGDWIIAQRAVSPLAEAPGTEILAESSLGTQVRAIHQRGSSAP